MCAYFFFACNSPYKSHMQVNILTQGQISRMQSACLPAASLPNWFHRRLSDHVACESTLNLSLRVFQTPQTPVPLPLQLSDADAICRLKGLDVPHNRHVWGRQPGKIIYSIKSAGTRWQADRLNVYMRGVPWQGDAARKRLIVWEHWRSVETHLRYRPVVTLVRWVYSFSLCASIGNSIKLLIWKKWKKKISIKILDSWFKLFFLAHLKLIQLPGSVAAGKLTKNTGMQLVWNCLTPSCIFDIYSLFLLFLKRKDQLKKRKVKQISIRNV